MRTDHSKWLIHFVRDRLPEQDFTDIDDEENYIPQPAGGELVSDERAFGVLLTIIKLGGLFPGYSMRRGKTTLYGGDPVVCATEMPLYSFAKYAQETKSSSVSSYGIAFLKSEFYEAGGRPVIYGLSDTAKYKEHNFISRIIDPSILSLNEQYRYVAYSPGGNKWIDWSHEREWRWKAHDIDSHKIYSYSDIGEADFYPGLPLFCGKENNGYFSRVAIIVWTKEEAEQIQHELTGYYFAGHNNYNTPFSKSLIYRSFIIILEDVVAAVEVDNVLASQSIEGIRDSSFIVPIIIQEDTDKYQPAIDVAMQKAYTAAANAAKDYIQKYPDDCGSCGYSNVASYDVTNPIIQQLLKTERATGPYDGKVIIRIRDAAPFRQQDLYNEIVTQAAVDSLNAELGKLFHVDSQPD